MQLPAAVGENLDRRGKVGTGIQFGKSAQHTTKVVIGRPQAKLKGGSRQLSPQHVLER